MARIRLGYGHGTGISSPIDVHVGTRMRQRRRYLEITQEELGDILGLAYQQVQKYERGTNRISASRLFKLSQVLDVSIEYFFDDMPPEVAATSPATRQHGRAKEPASYEPNPMAEREMPELVRAYYEIADAKIRKRLLEMTKALGAAASVDG